MGSANASELVLVLSVDEGTFRFWNPRLKDFGTHVPPKNFAIQQFDWLEVEFYAKIPKRMKTSKKATDGAFGLSFQHGDSKCSGLVYIPPLGYDDYGCCGHNMALGRVQLGGIGETDGVRAEFPGLAVQAEFDLKSDDDTTDGTIWMITDIQDISDEPIDEEIEQKLPWAGVIVNKADLASPDKSEGLLQSAVELRDDPSTDSDHAAEQPVITTEHQLLGQFMKLMKRPQFQSFLKKHPKMIDELMEMLTNL